ncbi:MAG: hypothetical protein AAGF47_00420 [Planctomycetota bacterium]
MSHRSRASDWMLLLAAVVTTAAVSCASAQSSAALDTYFIERSLEDVQAELIEYQLVGATGEERVALARHLAGVYIVLLDRTRGSPESSGWADRAASLLRSVPEAETPELTLELARSAYAVAEGVAERHRLRLADPQAVADAERTLRSVAPTFQVIAQQSHRLADRLEAELGRQLDRDDEEAVMGRLADARRLRSLGFYLAGWSEIYLAEMTSDPGRAEQALRRFGWLLGGGEGEPARLERFQPGLLQYEHIARAAIGSAIASALTGRAIEADAWLDAVERETAVPEQVRRQIPSRRAAVLAETSQWRDLDTLARRWLSPTAGETDPALARLIAVATLEADRDGVAGRDAELIRRLADAALQSLIAGGHLPHVVDLARLYGTDRLGSSGFVQAYVRGLLALDTAGGLAEDPGRSEDPVIVRAAFGEAGDLLAASLAERDATTYPSESATATLRAGQAFARANRVDDAAAMLEQAWRALTVRSDRDDALWSLVVALDDAVEAGRDDLAERRDRAALLYLGEFTASERAALLALRPSTAKLLSGEKAIEILLATPRTAASFDAAQRQAAALLYRAYRSAAPGQRDAAARRYITLAEVLVAEDTNRLRGLQSEAAADLAKVIVLRCRRLADAAFALDPPSLRAARDAVAAIDRTARFASIDLGDAGGEVAFRKMQIALAANDREAAAEALDALDAWGGPYRVAAVRLLYRDAVAAWLDRPGEAASAGDVLARAADVLATLEDRAARASVLAVVVEAAGVRWRAERDAAARAQGIEAGLELRALERDDPGTNRETARLLEAAGRTDEALGLWRVVLASQPPGTDAWFGARLASLELLAEKDAPAARITAQQFVTLHPDLGPTSVRTRFRDLLARLDVAVPAGASTRRGGP